MGGNKGGTLSIGAILGVRIADRFPLAMKVTLEDIC
jgi:hypothetical protein